MSPTKMGSLPTIANNRVGSNALKSDFLPVAAVVFTTCEENGLVEDESFVNKFVEIGFVATGFGVAMIGSISATFDPFVKVSTVGVKTCSSRRTLLKALLDFDSVRLDCASNAGDSNDAVGFGRTVVNSLFGFPGKPDSSAVNSPPENSFFCFEEADAGDSNSSKASSFDSTRLPADGVNDVKSGDVGDDAERTFS